MRRSLIPSDLEQNILEDESYSISIPLNGYEVIINRDNESCCKAIETDEHCLVYSPIGLKREERKDYLDTMFQEQTNYLEFIRKELDGSFIETDEELSHEREMERITKDSNVNMTPICKFVRIIMSPMFWIFGTTMKKTMQRRMTKNESALIKYDFMEREVHYGVDFFEKAISLLETDAPKEIRTKMQECYELSKKIGYVQARLALNAEKLSDASQRFYRLFYPDISGEVAN